MKIIRTSELVHFGDGCIRELVNVQDVDLMEMNTGLFNKLNHKPIEKFKEPIEAEILGVHQLEEDEINFVDFYKPVKEGISNQLPRKVLDKEQCMDREELENFIKTSQFDSIHEFFKDYLTEGD